MNVYVRSLGISVSLMSLFFFFQTPALSAQESAAPRSAATTVVAAEPQAAGQSVSAPSQVVPALPVPRLIKFSGAAKDASGQLRSGVVGITFSIYADQQGGATLWMETQNIELDAHGRYAVLLGSTRSAGLPLDLFATGEPRWLGAKLELPEEVEQPRVLLVSVPYALKASDADTVGGMPASAFVLAPTGSGADASTPGGAKSKAAESKVHPQFTSSGTANYIPLFTDSSGDIGNSKIYQGTGGVGIGWNGTMTANVVIGAPSGGAVLNSSNLVDQDMFVTLTAPGASDKHAYFGPSTATNLTLGTGGVEKVRITNAGNVGIGYSNPQQRLVIGAPAGGTVLNATNLADQDLNVIVSAPGASNKYTYFGPSVATNLTLGVGLTEMMRITSSGNVGIGTTAPVATLDVRGTGNFIASTTNEVIYANQTGVGISNSSFTNPPPAAVFGDATNATGLTVGVIGRSQSAPGAGLIGIATGVVTVSDRASGVLAAATATSGRQVGIDAAVYSTDTTPDDVIAAHFTNYGSTAGLIIKGDGPGTGCGTPPCKTTVFTVDGAGNTLVAGNLGVSGTLSKAAGSFKIDDPLDPANKYLYHSFVESPDMMNIYNGVVTLDARGSVWITLPQYFEALNQGFRYQLTSIGRPQPSLYVAREISGNRFKISGGKPGGKVSWQVTGIRHDAYADAHRIQVEEEKPPQEQGHYLHPELFGATPEQAVGYHAPASPTHAESARVSSLKAPLAPLE